MSALALPVLSKSRETIASQNLGFGREESTFRRLRLHSSTKEVEELLQPSITPRAQSVPAEQPTNSGEQQIDSVQQSGNAGQSTLLPTSVTSKGVGHDSSLEQLVVPELSRHFTPTQALPGSREKIQILRERYMNRLPLFHEDDRNDFRGFNLQEITRGRGNGRTEVADRLQLSGDAAKIEQRARKALAKKLRGIRSSLSGELTQEAMVESNRAKSTLSPLSSAKTRDLPPAETPRNTSIQEPTQVQRMFAMLQESVAKGHITASVLHDFKAQHPQLSSDNLINHACA